MSASLLDLIKAYGDARADWAERCSHRHVNRVPEALAAVEARIEAIREAVHSVHGVDGREADQLVGRVL